VEVPVVSDGFLRGWIHVGPHPHLRERSLEGIVPGMRAARILREIVVVWRPGLSAPPSGSAHRNAGVVADHPAAILIAGHGTPEAGDVRLLRKDGVTCDGNCGSHERRTQNDAQ